VEVGRGTWLVAGTTLREVIVVTLIPVKVKVDRKRPEGRWVIDDSSESDVDLEQFVGEGDPGGGRIPKFRERRFRLNSRGRRRLRRFNDDKPLAYRRIRAALMLYASIPQSTLDIYYRQYSEETVRLLIAEVEGEKEKKDEDAKRLARVQRNARRSKRRETSSSESDGSSLEDRRDYGQPSAPRHAPWVVSQLRDDRGIGPSEGRRFVADSHLARQRTEVVTAEQRAERNRIDRLLRGYSSEED